MPGRAGQVCFIPTLLRGLLRGPLAVPRAQGSSAGCSPLLAATARFSTFLFLLPLHLPPSRAETLIDAPHRGEGGLGLCKALALSYFISSIHLRLPRLPPSLSHGERRIPFRTCSLGNAHRVRGVCVCACGARVRFNRNKGNWS